ncbi:IPT/TIG domain-containing protein [Lacihabitans soyangensis]|nr:IPT/TIG domain-containing protein [Lacihabitans soyangensis]
MKKMHFNNSKLFTLICTILGFSMLIGCEKQDIFGENYDIDFPVPAVSAVSSKSALIGSTIILTGTNLDKVTSVKVGAENAEGKIVEKTSTSLKLQLPRIFSKGAFTVSNVYKQATTSSVTIDPIFPDVEITNYPTVIDRGQVFLIGGSNVDLIQEVMIGETKVRLDPTSQTEKQGIVNTQGVILSGDQTVIKVSKAYGKVINGISGAIAVQNYDPNAVYVAEQPIVIWDFEDGKNPFVNADILPISGINVSKLPKLRDQNYLTVKTDKADGWNKAIGFLTSTNPINLSKFHDPHLTFWINTNGSQGYFQLELQMGGVKSGGHFTPASSSSETDNYNFEKTNGWELRSISLKNFNWENWGSGKLKFNPQGIIESIALGYKQGNGKGFFELNIDQVQITDGPIKPVFTAFNFENNVNPYSGSAKSGINLSNIPSVSGERYLTVKVDNALSWNWTGDIYAGGPINLVNLKNPYISFWVNTNGKSGFFQIETTQNETKWGAGIDDANYLIKTNGWKRMNFSLKALGWGNWGGTSKALDMKGVLDYIKIGFSTGNASGVNYEVNIDDIVISDGAMY